MKVEIYSAQWCPACTKTKRWMDENNVEYEVKDVDIKENLIELQNLGFRSIPVTVIDGQTVNGFNPEEFRKLLITKQ